jgi:hypothetical protein
MVGEAAMSETDGEASLIARMKELVRRRSALKSLEIFIVGSEVPLDFIPRGDDRLEFGADYLSFPGSHSLNIVPLANITRFRIHWAVEDEANGRGA